ncbi:MAG: hypothetical protein WCW17_00040 [Patescibacteria group bacterium]
MKKLPNSLTVIVAGASTGITITRYRSGVATTQNLPIPWIPDSNGNIFWPLEWLRQLMVSIRSEARAGDVIAGGTWGADAALAIDKPTMDNVDWLLNPFHYRCIGKEYLYQALTNTTAEHVFEMSGGAAVASYQMYCQLHAYRKFYGDELDKVVAIIPIADLITYWLSGHQGHDKTILQSYGLLAYHGLQIYTQFSKLASKILPWQAIETSVMMADNDATVVPITHDSVRSRDFGFVFGDLVNWTGTWAGPAWRIPEFGAASAEMYRAGIAIEGIGPSRAAVCNSAHTPYYKAVCTQGGFVDNGQILFDQAAKAACREMRNINKIIDVSSCPNLPNEDLAIDLIGICNGNAALALATLIQSTAIAFDKVVTNMATLLGQNKPKQVVITGGWGNNKAYQRAVNLLGYEVIIPPNPEDATTLGVAMDALRRTGHALANLEALELLGVNCDFAYQS